MASSHWSSNLYVQDILAQPEALRKTIAALREPDTLRDLVKDLAGGRLRRIVLTGMGASYHALVPLHLRLVAAGLPAYLVETSELLYYYPALLTPDSLLIVVSQSGSSAEIAHLLKQVGGHEAVIGVTNTPGSPLARQADAVVLISAGDEVSVSCKTYVASLAALAWLGEKLIDGPAQDTARGWLGEAAQAMEDYLIGFESHIARLTEMLAGIGYVTFAGRGPSMAAVGTGALIIKEAAHFPSDGMGSAAFRHGPFEAVSQDQFVFIYTGPPDTAALNEKLYQDIRAAGGQAALIAVSPEIGPLTLPEVPLEVSPILEILPAQMISIALAELRGHAAGRFQRIAKVTSTE